MLWYFIFYYRLCNLSMWSLFTSITYVNKSFYDEKVAATCHFFPRSHLHWYLYQSSVFFPFCMDITGMKWSDTPVLLLLDCHYNQGILLGLLWLVLTLPCYLPSFFLLFFSSFSIWFSSSLGIMSIKCTSFFCLASSSRTFDLSLNSSRSFSWMVLSFRFRARSSLLLW